MRTKKKFPAALSVAAVLLCLVLVSAHFTSGMYARYTTRTKGSDLGHPAAFSVKAEAVQAGPVSISANGESTYQVKVTNDSEVAVHYVAKVTFTGSSDGVTLKDTVLTGDLAPRTSETRDVVFQLPGNPSADGDGTVPFTVTVDFTQID